MYTLLFVQSIELNTTNNIKVIYKLSVNIPIQLSLSIIKIQKNYLVVKKLNIDINNNYAVPYQHLLENISNVHDIKTVI